MPRAYRAAPVIGGALIVENLSEFPAIVWCHGIEVPIGCHTAHIIHGGRHGRPDARVDSGRVQRHAAPAADADDADLPGIRVVLYGKEIDSCAEILGVDVGRSHISRFAAAFSRVGRIKSDGKEASFGHGLRIEAGRLLLDCAEGTRHGQGSKLARSVFRCIHVSSQRDSVAVVKRYFFVADPAALRECLVPFF